MVNRKVYVGNLPYNVRISELKAAIGETFSSYGEIENIFLVRDRKRGTLKGFGFVTFTDAQAATASLALDGKVLKGRNMRVCIAKAKPEEKTQTSLLQRILNIFRRS